MEKKNELDKQYAVSLWLLVILSIFGLAGFISNNFFLKSSLLYVLLFITTAHLLFVVLFVDKNKRFFRLIFHLLLVFPVTVTISFHIALESSDFLHIDAFLFGFLWVIIPIMFLTPVLGSITTIPKWLYWFNPLIIAIQVLVVIVVEPSLTNVFFEVKNSFQIYSIIFTLCSMLLWLIVSWQLGLRISQNRETISGLNNELQQTNKQQKRDLLIQMHKYELLFAKSDDMLVLLDDGLNITEVNDVFLNRLNVDKEVVISKNIADFKSNLFNQSDLKFLSKRNTQLDHVINDFRLIDAQGRIIYTKARIRFSHKYNNVNYYLGILWDVTDLRFRELRDNELMETFGMVMRHLNHNLRGPLSTAMAVNQLYTLKYKEANFNEMCEGLTITSKLLEKIDYQLRRSVAGLEGYEEVWMKDVEHNHRGRVLVIDDNKDDIIILKTVIEDVIEGVNVISFTEAHMGLFYLENSISNNDICFIDVEMPRINGLEIIDTILKQSLRVGDVYIVSAHNYSDLLAKGFDITNYPFVKGIISKPLEIGAIKEVFASWKKL